MFLHEILQSPQFSSTRLTAHRHTDTHTHTHTHTHRHTHTHPHTHTPTHTHRQRSHPMCHVKSPLLCCAVLSSRWVQEERRSRHYSVHGAQSKLSRIPELEAGRLEITVPARWVGWFVACLTSQQHARASQGRISSDTEIEVADQAFHLTQSQYTDTGPTSPSTEPFTPGAWQGSHWSANF